MLRAARMVVQAPPASNCRRCGRLMLLGLNRQPGVEHDIDDQVADCDEPFWA